ncbi:replicative DNA helicase [Traorella massiliensis]|uniref:replicative DNA helicase n=1 Tax=Traorella massiliensis TaxID=1903263 RepID=UPI0023538E08|nr:replicative DNA helicase [Traorella massiliensis]
MALSTRQLPSSLEAEQAILGGMLVYPKVVGDVKDHDLTADDFFHENHQRLFRTMTYLIDQGQPVEPVGLITRLNDTHELNLVGGADYILKLTENAISSVNATTYIEVIKSRAQVRKLIETAQKIEAEGFENIKSLDELMDDAERKILDVTRQRRTTDFRSSGDILNTVMDRIQMLRSNKEKITGIKTGYVDLDHTTNGFQRGDLIILAARPSVGKTAFALNIALQSSLRNPGAVAIFSLEMPCEQLMQRILSAKSEVYGDKIRSGYISNEEMVRIQEACNEIRKTKIYIDDSAVIKMGDIFSKCRKLKSEQGLDMIIIDYLQLISSSSRSNSDNRQQEVSEISRSLKALARELDVPVIALSQLSRGVESRQDKHPMLSDLRESGSIEQDADIVMFLYRDSYQKKEEEAENAVDPVDVDIAKHRNGATRRFQLMFAKNINAFFNPEK